jgi:hypothetical protein
VEDRENGHNPNEVAEREAIKGAVFNLADLKREDGILTRNTQQYQSLLHRLITADHKHVPSEFKTALFRNSDEADDAVAAYIEAKDLGLDVEPVLLQVSARSAGVNLQLVRLIMEGLTHTTWTSATQQQPQQRGRRERSNTPLS